MRVALLTAFVFALEVFGVADPAFSIVMNVTGWSPMFEFQWGWTLDFEDGQVSSPPPVNDSDRVWLHVTGTSAVPYGIAGPRARVTDPIFATFTVEEAESITADIMETEVGEVQPLADLGTLQLRPYTIQLDPSGGGVLNIHYISIELPIVTEA